MLDNVTDRGVFASLEDTPLQGASAFLFASEWARMPKILIEAGALDLLVVASGVGSVPDLIDVTAGWKITRRNDVRDYVSALRESISEPDEASSRQHTARPREVAARSAHV